MLKIYHNARCSKSRQTLALITDNNIEVEIVNYLDTPPTAKELKELLKKLDMKPFDLIRKGETIFKENFKGKKYSDTEWIKIMTENPKLIERPIVVMGDKAVLGRPPENVKKLL